MDQVKIVNNYIKEKFSHFKEINKNLFSFEENNQEKLILIVTEKEKKLFSKDMKILLSKEEESINADYFAFNFGGQFYYIENSEKWKFHILRYLGKYEVDNSDFAHLAIHSTYSLLRGCQKLETYIEKAKYLNMKALGICEKQMLNSCIKFQDLCLANNIKPIIGEELKIRYKDEYYNFKFYVKNEKGWEDLVIISNIINVYQKAEDKDYILLDDIIGNEYLNNLIIIIPNNFNFDELGSRLINLDCYYQIDTIEYLNKDYYFEYLNNIKNYINSEWYKKIPCVLISDSYYLDKEDKYLQEIVKKIGNIQEFEFACVSQHFKSIEEHIEIFSKFFENKPELFDELMTKSISNTIEIVNKCNFELKFKKLHIPEAIIDESDWNGVLNEEEQYKL